MSLSSFGHLPECLNRCISSDNLAHRFIEDFIPSGMDTLDSGYCCFVGNDADLLGRLAVGIENSDGTDHCTKSAGESDGGNIPVGFGGSAADDYGVRRGAECHSPVLRLALTGFVDEDHDPAGAIWGYRFDGLGITPVEGTRVLINHRK
jgi:hypothetical protein